MEIKDYPKKLLEATEKELIALIGHAKSCSWKWVTQDDILTKSPCVLVYAILTAKNNNCTLTLHDGVNTSGRVICIIETTANQSRPYAFHGHVLTQRGLYANLSGDVEGLLMIWHDLPKVIGG